MQQKTHFSHSAGGKFTISSTISVSVSSATTSHQLCMNGMKQKKKNNRNSIKNRQPVDEMHSELYTSSRC